MEAGLVTQKAHKELEHQNMGSALRWMYRSVLLSSLFLEYEWSSLETCHLATHFANEPAKLPGLGVPYLLHPCFLPSTDHHTAWILAKQIAV